MVRGIHVRTDVFPVGDFLQVYLVGGKGEYFFHFQYGRANDGLTGGIFQADCLSFFEPCGKPVVQSVRQIHNPAEADGFGIPPHFFVRGLLSLFFGGTSYSYAGSYSRSSPTASCG